LILIQTQEDLFNCIYKIIIGSIDPTSYKIYYKFLYLIRILIKIAANSN